VSELRHVPVETWYGRTGESAQLSLSLFAGDTYPRPVVDHSDEARAFLRRYREFASL
jgi:deoxyribodipyrimidine photolyase